MHWVVLLTKSKSNNNKALKRFSSIRWSYKEYTTETLTDNCVEIYKTLAEDMGKTPDNINRLNIFISLIEDLFACGTPL